MATAKSKTSATRKTPEVDLEALTELLHQAQADAEEAVHQAIDAAAQSEKSAQAAVDKAMQRANAAAEEAMRQAIKQVSAPDPKEG